VLGTAVAVALFIACRSREINRALPIAIIASVLFSPHAHPQDASVFIVAASFSGAALLIGAALLPWPALMMVIDYVAFPFSYVLLGLTMIAYFIFRRGETAPAEAPDLVASGAD